MTENTIWPGYLPFGRDSALTISEIADRAKVSRRRVEKSIEIWRSEAVPICTGPEGVWITADPEELRDQYRRLRRRAIHQMANTRGLLRAARELDRTQMGFWA